jgi:alpha/beta hydrolase fold
MMLSLCRNRYTDLSVSARIETPIQLTARNPSESHHMLPPKIARLGLVLLSILSCNADAQSGRASTAQHTSYRTVKVDGVTIFYREAGPTDAPALLLLHGFPSSSRMYEPLFGRLSDRYHLVAPDYPGFGHSDWPTPKNFAYTFDHYAEIINRFTVAIGLSRYTLYMQDDVARNHKDAPYRRRSQD